MELCGVVCAAEVMATRIVFVASVVLASSCCLIKAYLHATNCLYDCHLAHCCFKVVIVATKL